MLDNPATTLGWLYQRARNFLFAPDTPVNLCVCRAIGFAWILFHYAGQDTRGFMILSDLLWEPGPLFGVLDALHLVPQSPGVMLAIDVTFKIALALASLGLFTRVSTAAAFFTGIYTFGYGMNFGAVDHRGGVLLLTIGIMACSRCGDAYSLDAWIRRRRGGRHGTSAPPTTTVLSAEYRWPVRMVWVVMAVAMCAAGVSKVFRGDGWFDSHSMSELFVSHYLSWQANVSSWTLVLARYDWLCMLMGLVAVFAELFAPLALISRRLRGVIITALALMQFGNGYLLGVHTMLPWLAAYVFWVPWDRIRLWLRSRMRGQTAVAST